MLLALLSSLAIAGPRPCATLELLPSAPPLRKHVAAPLPPPGELELRDVYEVPNVLPGEHFAIRWGTGGGVTTAEVERLLGAFEDAWAVQIEAQAHPPPTGTDTHLFNVYVGDTGDGAPSSYGAAGYYWVDTEGWPMIVVAASVLNDGNAADGTAAHEFYHAVQGSLDRYDYDGLGAWFWEATAEWAAIETYPDNPDNGYFVFGYLLLPHLPVNAFDYVDTGALEEYHQYGAFLFPHYLTTEIADYTLVRDAWVVPGEDDDPIEVMRAWLADAGHDLDEVWLDHIAHNAVYDYAQGDAWEELVSWTEGWYSEGRPITASHTEHGTTEPDRIQGKEKAPRRYGYNVILLEDAAEGDLVVRIEGDATGSDGSEARFGARVVREIDGAPVYSEVPFDGTVGELTLPVEAKEDVWLVIGAWTVGTDHWKNEVFPYSYEITAGVEEPEIVRPAPIDAHSDRVEYACGCATGPSRIAWPVLLLVTLVRRRRATG